MSWFQLDAKSIADRTLNSSRPSLMSSLVRGALGFTLVSLAGFTPWAVFGRWFHKRGGELSMYLVCALVFVGLSGVCLHGLILGRGSLARFYKLFGVAFSLYSIAWIAGWMALRGHVGSVVGLLAGTVLMGIIFVRAFESPRQLVPVIAALFLLNSVGYFAGGVLEGMLIGAKQLMVLGAPLAKPVQARIAMLSWGLCYGLGFGAGLGLAFHLCQAQARSLLQDRGPISA